MDCAIPLAPRAWNGVLALGSISASFDSLQLLPVAHVCQAWRAAVQPL